MDNDKLNTVITSMADAVAEAIDRTRRMIPWGSRGSHSSEFADLLRSPGSTARGEVAQALRPILEPLLAEQPGELAEIERLIREVEAARGGGIEVSMAVIASEPNLFGEIRDFLSRKSLCSYNEFSDSTAKTPADALRSLLPVKYRKPEPSNLTGSLTLDGRRYTICATPVPDGESPTTTD